MVRSVKVLKGFAKPVEAVPSIDGLKLEMEIPHKSFLETAAAPDYDALQVYAPAKQIERFSEAEITNQQFMDQCIILVNGDRIQVPLSSTGN